MITDQATIASGDVAPDPTKDRAFNVLSDECNGAELVSAIIECKPFAGPTRYLNGWSCLRFLPEAEAAAITHLTDKPRSVHAMHGKARLMASRSTLTVGEARALLPTDDFFVNPRVMLPIKVESPGEWLAGRVAGIDDADLRSLFPTEVHTLYTYEKRTQAESIRELFGTRGMKDFFELVNEFVGVDLERNHHRVGEFLVGVPSVWPEVRTSVGAGRRRMGIEIRFTRPRGSTCTAILSELDDERHERSQCRVLPEGLHVVDTHPDLSSYELRVYGGDGLLRHLERFALFREMRTEMRLGRAAGTISLQIDGKSTSASYSWATPQVLTMGDAAPSSRKAERGVVAAHEEHARLASGHVIVFAGGQSERSRALGAIRKLINGARSHVFIVDPYFGAQEMLEFVTALQNPAIELRVLVRGVRTRDHARNGLAALNATLASAGDAQLSRCEIRAASGTVLHDRFIAVDTQWWQLGTSLNSVGDNMSTIALFSAPLQMGRLFQTPWQKAR